MRLKHYTIEVRNPTLGYWEVKHTVQPHVETVKRQTSRFFSTKVTEEMVDEPPSSSAQQDCREFAMLWAFEFYSAPSEDVRVRKTYIYEDCYTYSSTVWENGEWEGLLTMLSKVLMYEIETIHIKDSQPKWKLRDTIIPRYQYAENVATRRFLWWTWTATHLMLSNERKARIQARRKAFKIAKKLYPEYAVRVFVVFKFPEVDEPIRHCVWENGHYYSTH